MKSRWYSKQWKVVRRSSVLVGLLLAAYLAAGRRARDFLGIGFSSLTM